MIVTYGWSLPCEIDSSFDLVDETWFTWLCILNLITNRIWQKKLIFVVSIIVLCLYISKKNIPIKLTKTHLDSLNLKLYSSLKLQNTFCLFYNLINKIPRWRISYIFVVIINNPYIFFLVNDIQLLNLI